MTIKSDTKFDLRFGKWHEELGLWCDPVIQSRKLLSLKLTEELCIMTMKNDAKFEEELTCQFKIDMRNLTNFDLSTRKSQKNFALMSYFWPKYIMFELKKYRRVMFDDTEHWWKIWKKTDLCFMRNLANFHRLEKGNFILESKMVELNQNQNSKQLDWTDAVRRLYFFLEINE